MLLHRTNRIKFLLTVLLLSVGFSVQAQFYNGLNMTFGKNRVQWDDFHWSYYRNDKFDIYYYQGGQDLAKYAQQYAKTQISLMEAKLGGQFGKKIQFLVFNSLSDFKQSNINNEEEDTRNTGGETKILGTKVFLYFDGNYVNFETQIREGIAQLLMNQLMNGISIGSQIRNSYRYEIPQWFQNGLCAYVAQDWNSYKEDRLQRGILTGSYKKINQLRDEDAIIAGYSFWNFVDEKYGEKSFRDVMTLAASTQNVKKALLYITGVEYKQLIKDWYGFYQHRYSTLLQNKPNDPMQLKYRKHRTFTEPCISPDGKNMAYVSNDEGRITLWIENLQNHKKQKLFKTGYRSDEHIDTSFPLLAWHPNGEILSFIIEEKGKILLCNIDINTRKTAQTYLFEFQKITSFSYAHKSRKIVLAATRDGKPDIFVYNLFSNTTEQITNDFHTDLDPVFSADDKHIYFSSNRVSDSLNPKLKPSAQGLQFDIYAYHYAAKQPSLQNLTQQKVSSNIKPLTLKDGSLLYLSDSNGFFNLYQAQLDSAISFIDTTIHYRYFTHTRQLTNYSSSIINYSYHPRDNRVAILMPDESGEKIHLSPFLSQNNTAPITQMSPYAQKRLLDNQLSQITDTLKRTTAHRFSTSYRKPRRKKQSITPFSDSIVPTETPIAERPRYRDTIQRPNNYYVELFSDKLISQIDFSSLNYSYQPFTGGIMPVYLNSGFNIFLGASINDLMEDVRIDAGVKLNTSLVNNEYILRFSNFSKRIDKSLTLHRYVTDANPDYYYRTFTDEAFYTMSYPFNETLALKGTLIYRNDYKVNLPINDVSLADPNTMVNWGGLRGELVYDNSRKLETNLYVGTRGKIFAEYHQLIARGSKNMIVAGFDFRHYTRIHRNFIWANRIAGSSSFGQDKLIYYMGGVDNWLPARFDQRTPIDYGQNYAYQTLATNMRGFDQNIRNGNSFVVLNSELRFPVFTYLLNRPVNMEFLKNFQIVAFGDVGTAWTGWNPYDLSNSLYTSHYADGNLSISVTELKEPIVGGFGLGLRTKILGYFVRGDMAWGIEDGNISKKPKFYLSFNLDF